MDKYIVVYFEKHLIKEIKMFDKEDLLKEVHKLLEERLNDVNDIPFSTLVSTLSFYEFITLFNQTFNIPKSNNWIIISQYYQPANKWFPM